LWILNSGEFVIQARKPSPNGSDVNGKVSTTNKKFSRMKSHQENLQAYYSWFWLVFVAVAYPKYELSISINPDGNYFRNPFPYERITD